MAEDKNKDFLEASDQDLQSLTEYIDSEENAEVYDEIERTHAAGAQRIVDAVIGKTASDVPPANQMSMFDKDDFLKKAKEHANKIAQQKENENNSTPIHNAPKRPNSPIGSAPHRPNGIPSKPGMPNKIGAPKPLKKTETNESPLVKKGNPFTQPENKENIKTETIEEAKETKVEQVTEETKETNVDLTANTEEVKQVEQTTSTEEVKTEEKQKEVTPIEEEKEEVKEEPKKKKRKKSSKKKTEENTEEDIAEEATESLPEETVTNCAEALIAIKTVYEDQEWKDFEKKVSEKFNDIQITSDMSTEQINQAIADLSTLKDEVSLTFIEVQSDYSNLIEKDGLIDRIRQKNLIGSNEQERKRNAIKALEHTSINGQVVNLYKLHDNINARYKFVEHFLDNFAQKKSFLLNIINAKQLAK